jgi:hypothetical protein
MLHTVLATDTLVTTGAQYQSLYLPNQSSSSSTDIAGRKELRVIHNSGGIVTSRRPMPHNKLRSATVRRSHKHPIFSSYNSLPTRGKDFAGVPRTVTIYFSAYFPYFEKIKAGL